MLLRLLKDSGWPAVTGKQVRVHFRCVPGLPAGRASSESKLVRHSDVPRGLPASRESSEIKLIAFPMTFLSLPRPIRHRDQKNCRNRCASCQIQGKNIIGNSLFLKFADQQPQVPAKLSTKTSLFFFPLTSSPGSRLNCQQKTSLFVFPLTNSRRTGRLSTKSKFGFISDASLAYRPAARHRKTSW
jgi:hypothetical protein